MSAVAPDPSLDPATRVAAQLYERHAGRVLAECSHRLRRREDAEEAVQTTFLRAVGALRRGERPRAERAWLLTIARNVCATTADRANRRGEVELEPAVLERIVPGAEDDRGLGEELERALAALPDGHRRAFLLRAYGGLSYAEIAAELGVTVAAVETWIFRARRSLASALGGERRRFGFLEVPSALGAVKSLVGGAGVAAKIALATAAATVAAGTFAATVQLTDRTDPDAPAPAEAPLPLRSDRIEVPPPATRVQERQRDSAVAPRGADVVREPATPGTTETPRPSADAPAPTIAGPTSAPVDTAPDPVTSDPPAPAVTELTEALPEVEVPEAALPELPALPIETPQFPTPTLPDVPIVVEPPSLP